MLIIKQLSLRSTLFCILASVLMMACSRGGSGDEPPLEPEFVAISGRLTYDRIPFSVSLLQGLDYSDIQVLPIRGVRVQLLDNAGNILDIDTSDANGEYEFPFVAAQLEVRIRVVAELSKTSLPAWDVQVRDHTQNDALYVLDGELVTSGTRDTVRDLHASSGWDPLDSGYSGPRAAAPFAILDTIYTGLQRLSAIDNTVRLDELDIFWSPNNSSATHVFANGDIGGSFYRNQEIYVLGQENGDTDEYDEHVLLHEWAHFIEDTLSRTDTLGGRHNIVESLDLRLAFAEGLANAWSGMMLNDPVYRNSLGDGQASLFSFDLEYNPGASVADNRGWFVESSIHSLLYDFYDDQQDGLDTIDAGLGPIFSVLTDPSYIEGSALRSIYPFIHRFRTQPGVDTVVVDNLVAQQAITGFGDYGVGEINDGGFAGNLPLFIPLHVNDSSPTSVCTSKSSASGEINKLGNRRLVRFSTVADNHQLIVSYSGGFLPSNPALRLFYQGQALFSFPQPGTQAYTTPGDSLNVSVGLGNVGEYILEIFSRSNVDGDFDTGGDVCFDVSVTR